MGSIYGPFSDALGRREVFSAGMLFFTLFFPFFLQGLGSSVAWILGLSIVKDIYQHQESFKILSVIGTILAIVLGLAPVVGWCIAIFWGWRLIFLDSCRLSTSSSFLSHLYISRNSSSRKIQKLYLRVAMSNYWRLLRNRRFV